MATSVDSKGDGKTAKMPGAASDGEFWISKVLKAIVALEKDTKHVVPLYQLDDQKLETRNRVFSTTQKITVRLIILYRIPALTILAGNQRKPGIR